MMTPSTAEFWPASSLAGDQDKILRHLERSTPVRLMAIIGDLTTAKAGEPVQAATERANKHRFDYLPVQADSGDTIIGIFCRKEVPTDADATVSDVMRPLSGSNLISADAPLLEFIYAADMQPCRLVLDGAKIDGLVTLSDIQRLPVRTALFGLFIHLELLLTEAIRLAIGGKTPFEFLSDARAEEGKKRWANFNVGGMDHDPISALMFSDKKTIAKKIRFLGLSAPPRSTENSSRSRIASEILSPTVVNMR
jgi:CBS domain-containing protein